MKTVFKHIEIILLATISVGIIYALFRNVIYELILQSLSSNRVFWASLSQIVLVPIIYWFFSYYNKQINRLTRDDVGYYLNNKAIRGFLIGSLYTLPFFILSVFTYQIIAEHTISMELSLKLRRKPIVGSFFQNLGGAGSFEEFFTRGFVFIYLVHVAKTKTISSVLISSLLFTSLHFISFNGDYVWILQTFLFGVFVNLLYIKFNNIWVAVGFHTIWNTFYQFMVTANLEFNRKLLKRCICSCSSLVHH